MNGVEYYAFPLHLTSPRIYFHSQMYMKVKDQKENKISKTFGMEKLKNIYFKKKKNDGFVREKRLAQKPSWKV